MRQIALFWLLFALILLFPLLLQQLQIRWNHLTPQPKSPSSPKPRVLKPKTDKIVLAAGQKPLAEAIYPMFAPKISSHGACRKGVGGRKKGVRTQGFFCSNPRCSYYLIADEAIRALVGYGSHGKYERIQDLRCQCCRKKFTIRRHTVLYRTKTLSTTVAKVLHLLVVGTDISAIEEVFGFREMTIRTWLSRGRIHGEKLHQRFFANLELSHVQLDELWANVRQSKQDLWVWVACEAKHKLIPVLQVGPRTQQMAYAVVHELKGRLKPGCVPVFSSDGLKHYFYVLTAHPSTGSGHALANGCHRPKVENRCGRSWQISPMPR